MSKYASMACALMWPLLVLLLHDDVGSWPLLVIGAALLAWRMPQARYLAAAAAVLLVALGGLGHAELGMRAYPVAVNAVMLAIFSLACGEECRSSNVWRACASPSCPPPAYAIPEMSLGHGVAFSYSTVPSQAGQRCTQAWQHGHCTTVPSAMA